MDQKLSVLIIEDNANDADLNVSILRKAGYSVYYNRVETDEEMKFALESKKWDIILSDYQMPKFDVLSALAIYNSFGIDIPFIVVSGAIGEARAVEMIKAGAHDYVLKDNMTRFPSVVKRELQEAHIRQQFSHANAMLKKSEERYRTMIKASPDGIFITDLNGVITEVSEMGVTLYNADNQDQLVGKHFSFLIPPDDKGKLDEIFEGTMMDGISQNIEVRFLRKDGSLLITETSVTLLHDSVNRPISYMIIIRDVTQRKNLEMQLIHSERMAGLGEMASGIAHEINQPLNTISMALDNILSEFMTEGTIEKDYISKKSEKIFENVTRIRNIIDHIRVFSRGHDDYVVTGFSINTSILNAISLISEQFKHNAIQLKLELGDNLPVINGNTFKFEQVILNLLSNARDALLEKEQKLGCAFEKSIRIATFQKSDLICTEVTDNGVGIAKTNIDQVTMPFFTTKEPGKGTGLGLSVSYRILRDMNGTMAFNSNEMEGTTVQIVLHQTKGAKA